MQGAVLVVGRDAGIAVFHAPIVGQTLGTSKSAFLAALRIVPKLTLCDQETANRLECTRYRLSNIRGTFYNMSAVVLSSTAGENNLYRALY
jgi:hypothetical protein